MYLLDAASAVTAVATATSVIIKFLILAAMSARKKLL